MEPIQTFPELGVAEGHRLVKILLGDRLGDFACLTCAEGHKDKQIVRIPSRFVLHRKARTILTASIRGTRVILFSRTPIMYDGVSGVASRRASTASTPCRVGYHNVIQSIRLT